MTENTVHSRPRLLRHIRAAIRQGKFSSLGTMVLLALTLLVSTTPTRGADTTVGIQGHYRAGQWTAVRMQWDAPDVVIETTDGDGVPVVYQQNFLSAQRGDENPVFGYCIPGTEAAPLIVRPGELETEAEKPAYLRTRFPERGTPAEGPAMIPIEMPWVVVFGDPLGIETIGANELLGRDASVAVTTIATPDPIPDHALGWSGVDLIVITGSGSETLEQLSGSQGDAIIDWVHGGGRLLVTLGASAASTLDAAEWLTDLLPEDVSQSSIARMRPSGLETFTNSQTRLREFEGWRLPKTASAGAVALSSVGEVLIAGRTTRGISLPLAARYTAGFGKVTVLSADLETAPFTDWPERLELVTKLNGTLFTEDRGELGSNVRLSGYSDLAGQVRRSLDQFPIKRPFSFSIVALIIVGLILLVAPLDYLLVRRVLGNPILGWITFPVVAVLLSVALVLAASPRVDPETIPAAASPASRSVSDNEIEVDQMRANAIEILDLDSVAQTGRLFRWSFLYSHPAQSVRVLAQQSEALLSIMGETKYRMLAPFGVPGRSMGGIQIDSWSDPMYVPIERIGRHRGDDARGRPDDLQGDADELQPHLVSHIDTLEFAPRSSKSIALQTQFTASIESTPLRRRRSSELLQGPLTNPLEVDLLDSMLIYRNLVYLLPTRFPTGETVKEVDRLRQKNFRWQLARQRALESSSQTEAWDVTRSDQTDRLAEMLMFHDVAGGIRYTGLQNEVLGRLDFTDLLTRDQCILVGRCAQPWATIGVTETETTDPLSIPRGETQSWVRVILPVISD